MSAEDVKKKRFIFLKALYDLSNGSRKALIMEEVGNKAQFDSQLVHDVVDYLTKNDLVRKYHPGGKLRELIESEEIIVLRNNGTKK